MGLNIDTEKYAELEEYMDMFAKRLLPLLVVVGRGGIGKSEAAKAIIPHAFVLEGNCSTYGLYRQLFAHRNEDIILDDLDHFWRDQAAIRILRVVCDTREIRTVRWDKASPALKADNLPITFTTTSRICVIANEWRALNAGAKALLDRGVRLTFTPSNTEIHQRAQQWFSKDQEILQFIGGHLTQIPELSFRDYELAFGFKSGGKDWRKILLRNWKIDPTVATALELIADPKLTPANRLNEFMRRTGRSRRQWFYYLDRFKDQLVAPAATDTSTSHCTIALGAVEAAPATKCNGAMQTKHQHHASTKAGAAPIRRRAEKLPVSVDLQTESTKAA